MSMPDLQDPIFSFSTAIHNTIGTMADDRLNGTSTQTSVHALLQSKLGPHSTLGSPLVAAWADSVKKMSVQAAQQVPDNGETVAFLQDNANKGNGNWHFVNLPAAASAYDPALFPPPFTDPHDVVHMLQEALKVLTGATTRFSKFNALRLLVHLTGDVHQPLHVGCSYLRPNGQESFDLVLDPTQAAGLANDQGGNALMLSSSRNLHSLWDGTLPANVDLGDDPADTDDPDPAMPVGHLLDWPALWATETLHVANAAYTGLTVLGLHGDVAPGHHQAAHLDIKLPSGYQSHFSPIARRQAATAARRLAATLKVLFP